MSLVAGVLCVQAQVWVLSITGKFKFDGSCKSRQVSSMTPTSARYHLLVPRNQDIYHS